ncbi:mucin-associated surface protein (MASP), putative [Trypanosoma cruzi marinkellei]|uniref:Mucin-associated surface protein (MASP), putative n=1 Tax=Trypanosoma cruzi marinkellei TaxID=85056 RepID=K2NLC1_TRYCR|nr:mucin-associated surface protein (MASP), putative [Trypanosoma cruzi marinkellei]
MMMMMTGRVLLVLALCVLWCGIAGGGGCSETAPAEEAPVSVTLQEKNVQPENTTVVGVDQNGKTETSQEATESSVQDIQTAGAKAADPSPEPKSGEKASETANTTTEDSKDKTKEEEEEVNQDEEEGDDENEENEEEDEDDEEGEKEEKDEKDDNSTTKEMSTGVQEQQSLSSGAEGTSNKTKLKSTQTTDSEDGSTAASHTTSPLLLLLLVAAAVVAA